MKLADAVTLLCNSAPKVGCLFKNPLVVMEAAAEAVTRGNLASHRALN